MTLSMCAAGAHAQASSRPTQSDGGFAAVAADNESLACPLCGLCDDDKHTGRDGRDVRSRDLILCEGCQDGFHAACTRALLSLRRLLLPTGHPAAVDWPTEGMERGSSTWRCGLCVKEGRWGVSHLIESAVTFSDSRCAKGPATYSVLVRFHAAGGAPEPRYLHGRAPPGCDDASAIQDHELYHAEGRARITSSFIFCSSRP